MRRSRQLASLSVRVTACAVALWSAASSSRADGPGRVEVVWDRWGVPHVFAPTDEAAMFGLGYATAVDRGFQIHLARRTMRGRLAETVGDVATARRDESAVDLDRKNRAFGWGRAADRLAGALDGETRTLMSAYASGVNHAWAERGDRLDPLFARFGTEPEPWTPADSILCWWHLARFFAGDGTRDLIAHRNRPGGPGPGGDRPPPNLTPDDEAAVIRREDVSDAWLGRVRDFLQAEGFEVGSDPARAGEDGPKFSHAWVVGGRRSTTGSSLLVGMPQTVVANPPLLYEFHVEGAGFNARGVGPPGSPGLLIGFSRDLAWSLTALGADQADLFRLRTDPGRPDQYEFDGTWRGMDVRDETILVRGGEPVTVRVRETHLGPVMTDFAFAQPGEGEVALKRVPLCDADRETIQSSFAMIRARDAAEFDAALAGWRFPSANVVFGDRAGAIGYRTIGAFPLRPPSAEGSGAMALDGSGAAGDWRGFVPHDLVPHVLDPSSGVLFSGNHRPIESFYPVPLGIGTGSLGDSVRSWRLRERLGRPGPFTPEEVFAVADDAVNPARREIVRLGFHLRDGLGADLPIEARRALEVLEGWRARGSRSDDRGAALAMEISTLFRPGSTPLAVVHVGGESGLARWLRSVAARIEEDPAADLDPDERAYITRALADAWLAAVEWYGPDPDTWDEARRQDRTGAKVAAYRGLDGLASLDPDRDLGTPPLPCTDAGTIRSDGARAYVQLVRLDDPDRSQSILPQGNRESPGRTATRDLWSRGELHPAPLSREAVEAIAAERVELAWPPPR